MDSNSYVVEKVIGVVPDATRIVYGVAQRQMRPSRNSITIDQLRMACRHVEELRGAGVTENLAIRTLELFADVYAKLRVMGNANPNRANDVELWSKAALDLKKTRPNARANECFRVEHGTPRREFARKVMELYKRDALTEKAIATLVKKFWKLAVITLDEDVKLNGISRSRCFGSPDMRWNAAGIEFPQKETHDRD